MDLAFITPTSYLEKYATQGDIYLALAHLIDDDGENEYARFHRREALKGRRVILDNGLFEGAQVSTDALLHRARAINASVVCAPDVLYDSAGTIKEFKQFIRAKQEFGLVCEVMGIPQADNPAGWWECFRFFDLSKDCDLIGLSILAIPQSFGELVGGRDKITASRMHVIQQLYAHTSLLGRRSTPCHMLGLGDSYEDLKLANRLLPSVVSNDTSSAFIHGKHSVRYREDGTWDGGKIREKVDFDEPFSEDLDHKAIQHNLNIAKKVGHGIRR